MHWAADEGLEVGPTTQVKKVDRTFSGRRRNHHLPIP